MTESYPLQWSEGWPRDGGRRPSGSKFGRDLTVDRARRRLSDELRLLGAAEPIISTNLELRRDGFPYSNQRRVDDLGVAVYFDAFNQSLVMAYDLWNTVEANINALALAIHGMRQMERHGGAHMMERAFTGFAALPSPDHKRPYWQVLGVDEHAPLPACRAAFRRLAIERHPDHGGSDSLMADLNAAYADAKEFLQAPF